MRQRLVAALVATLLGTTGCGGRTEPLVSPDVPAFTTERPRGGDLVRTVPPSCGEVATAEEISRVLSNLVTGQTLPVVGVPRDDIGRTARLDCYYGVPAGQAIAAATIWIGLATYTDSDSARKRVTNTIADERAAGATASDVPVGGARGVLLKSTKWMLVATRGRTTVVVQVVPTMVREDHAGALLGELADLALTPRDTS